MRRTSDKQKELQVKTEALLFSQQPINEADFLLCSFLQPWHGHDHDSNVIVTTAFVRKGDKRLCRMLHILLRAGDHEDLIIPNQVQQAVVS